MNLHLETNKKRILIKKNRFFQYTVRNLIGWENNCQRQKKERCDLHLLYFYWLGCILETLRNNLFFIQSKTEHLRIFVTDKLYSTSHFKEIHIFYTRIRENGLTINQKDRKMKNIIFFCKIGHLDSFIKTSTIIKRDIISTFI